MSELATLLPSLVSRGTRLALVLYDHAATVEETSEVVGRAAAAVAEFERTAKQLDISLKDDNSIPTAEATETVQMISTQAAKVFDMIEYHCLGAGSSNDGTTNDKNRFPMERDRKSVV